MYHINKNGKQLIASMDNEHLNNTIMLLIKKGIEAFQYVNAPQGFTGIESIAYDIDTESMKERAEDIIEEVFETLPKYIFEATIRGIDYSEKLQELTGRNSSLLTANNIQKLEALESGSYLF